MSGDLELVRRLAAADKGLAVVSAVRRDGTVHSSLVNAGVFDHPVSKEPAVALVARGDAYKLRLFATAGRANAVFRAGWQWVSVEGPVDIIGPDHPRPEFPADGSRSSCATSSPPPVARTTTGPNTTGSWPRNAAPPSSSRRPASPRTDNRP